MFRWDKDIVGRKIDCHFQTGEIIGAVKDFHFSSLHTQTEPLVLLVPKTKIEYLCVRISVADERKALAHLESDFKAIAPHLPFDFHIRMNTWISGIARISDFLNSLIFCGLPIFLACLRLYGVIPLMAESRAKEIGSGKFWVPLLRE